METSENLEKKLSALPKHKLRFTANLKIKTIIYKMMIQKKITDFSNSFSFKGFFLHKAWLVGVLALAMLSSVSFYAYGSEQVTLGTPLYPLKKTIETTKNKLTSSDVEKAKNFNELSTRRLEEALILSNKESKVNQENKKIENNNNIVKTIDKAMENFDKSVISTETIGDEQELKATINKIRKSNDDNLQVLEKIEKNVNISEQEDIAEKISEAKNKIEKYNHDSEEEDEDRENERDGEDREDNENKDEPREDRREGERRENRD